MKEFFKDILSDKTTKYCFLVAISLSAISLVIILITYKSLPPYIPIFNQMPWGEKRLGIPLTIFVPLITNLFILGMNMILAAIIYKKQPLTSRVLMITTVTTSTINLVI